MALIFEKRANLALNVSHAKNRSVAKILFHILIFNL